VTVPEVRRTVTAAVQARRETLPVVMAEGTVELTSVSGPVGLAETSPVNVRAEGGALRVTVASFTAALSKGVVGAPQTGAGDVVTEVSRLTLTRTATIVPECS